MQAAVDRLAVTLGHSVLIEDVDQYPVWWTPSAPSIAPGCARSSTDMSIRRPPRSSLTSIWQRPSARCAHRRCPTPTCGRAGACPSGTTTSFWASLGPRSRSDCRRGSPPDACRLRGVGGRDHGGSSADGREHDAPSRRADRAPAGRSRRGCRTGSRPVEGTSVRHARTGVRARSRRRLATAQLDECACDRHLRPSATSGSPLPLVELGRRPAGNGHAPGHRRRRADRPGVVGCARRLAAHRRGSRVIEPLRHSSGGRCARPAAKPALMTTARVILVPRRRHRGLPPKVLHLHHTTLYFRIDRSSSSPRRPRSGPARVDLQLALWLTAFRGIDRSQLRLRHLSEFGAEISSSTRMHRRR